MEGWRVVVKEGNGAPHRKWRNEEESMEGLRVVVGEENGVPHRQWKDEKDGMERREEI